MDAFFHYLRQLKLGSHGVVSGREVVLLDNLSLGAELFLVLGELASQGSGELGSELNWLSSQSVLGAVLGVELLQGLRVLEGALQLGSLLVIDDGQASGDGLSDELLLDSENNSDGCLANSQKDFLDWGCHFAHFFKETRNFASCHLSNANLPSFRAECQRASP